MLQKTRYLMMQWKVVPEQRSRSCWSKAFHPDVCRLPLRPAGPSGYDAIASTRVARSLLSTYRERMDTNRSSVFPAAPPPALGKASQASKKWFRPPAAPAACSGQSLLGVKEMVRVSCGSAACSGQSLLGVKEMVRVSCGSAACSAERLCLSVQSAPNSSRGYAARRLKACYALAGMSLLA